MLFVTFCQYKMPLFKFIGFGLFFVRPRGGSVQIFLSFLKFLKLNVLRK